MCTVVIEIVEVIANNNYSKDFAILVLVPIGGDLPATLQ